MRLRRSNGDVPEAADPAELAADVRTLRHRVAIELTRELSDAEIARVGEIAHAILGMTMNERACLGALLAEVQGSVTVDHVQPPEQVWPDDVPFA